MANVTELQPAMEQRARSYSVPRPKGSQYVRDLARIGIHVHVNRSARNRVDLHLPAGWRVERENKQIVRIFDARNRCRVRITPGDRIQIVPAYEVIHRHIKGDEYKVVILNNVSGTDIKTQKACGGKHMLLVKARMRITMKELFPQVDKPWMYWEVSPRRKQQVQRAS